MLKPDNRRYLLEVLRPPEGYQLSEAVGTTFSLDLLALLTAPVAFTIFQWQNTDTGQSDPLALLQAARTYAERITLFCQAGRIAVPKSVQPLFSYLERSVIEVMPPNPARAFHPKVWLLRFVSKMGSVRYRMLCLIRNLTFDRSWDTALVMDGALTDRTYAYSINHPLGDFLAALPSMALRPPLPEIWQRIERLQHEVRRVRFEVPAPFQSYAFFPMGLSSRATWPFPADRVDRTLVVSPFVTARTLQRLTRLGRNHVLIARMEELACTPPDVLAGFEQIYTLDEAASAELAESGDEDDGISTQEPELTGLHAKLYVTEAGGDASLWTGSPNATHAAFHGNVEFMVRLDGKRRQCGIEAILGLGDTEFGLHNLLRTYEPAPPVPTDPVVERLEKRLEQVRYSLAKHHWTATVSPGIEGETYNVQLQSKDVISIEDVQVRCWPITLSPSKAAEVPAAPESATVVQFNGLTPESITGFFAFSATAFEANQQRTSRFVLTAELVGLPLERDSHVLRSLPQNREQVVRFLLMLLAGGEDGLDSALALFFQLDGTGADSRKQIEDFPLLEVMVRALDRAPEKLETVEQLLADLKKAPQWPAPAARGAGRGLAGCMASTESTRSMNDTQQVRPDPALILQGLKDFQRDTVDYVFRRFFLDGEQTTRRFLVADEVGLGKTLVARGLIAHTVDHLWDMVERIDVVYLCSNAEIARQNIRKLNITGNDDFALPSRITLLPITVHNLQQHRINFLSLTPGTSLNLRSNTGIVEERALLHALLSAPWSLRGEGPLNLLQCWAGRDRFRGMVQSFRRYYRVNLRLEEAFIQALDKRLRLERNQGRPDLRSRFESLCDEYCDVGEQWSVPLRVRQERDAVVGELRRELARACIAAIEPDLIILDEFQRFRDLLETRSEVGELAHELFDYADEHSATRVLLLSATPYKMYTTVGDDQDDHYADFLRTVQFLLDDPSAARSFEALLAQYRQALFRLDDSGSFENLRQIKEQIEHQLRQVMVRTERLAVTADRNGMLREISNSTEPPAVSDLLAYVSLQQIARALDHHDTLEYWKSAPYLLNFMDANYKLKRQLQNVAKQAQAASQFAPLLADAAAQLLSRETIRRYEPLDPGNVCMRRLMADTIERGWWRLLWMPPSCPYYEMGEPFVAQQAVGVTKRLIFSSWQVVPRAIASLLSYEAERRMITLFDPEAENTPEARQRRAQLLQFARSRERLTGMPVLGLLYPAIVLAERCDPLQFMADSRGRRLTWQEAQQTIQALLVPLLEHPDLPDPSDGAEDERWYWAAPILLDRIFHPEQTQRWFDRENLASPWSGGSAAESDNSAWADHVLEARAMAFAPHRLGRRPNDLAEVLAQIALAGPAVTALRALGRVSGGRASYRIDAVRFSATQVAWAFRTLFNLPEATALIRGLHGVESRLPYWRQILNYSLWGGLQAVLDEYAHVLRESLGLLDGAADTVAPAVAEAMVAAISLRTADPAIDQIEIEGPGQRFTIESQRIRNRFALQFGDQQTADGAAGARADQVRAAFNAPFWPFVLASTSVGQEGLDFHLYCHAVVHWNLPSNLVDLEQREGRVHRYKGHAVRKNLAARVGDEVLGQGTLVDPWEAMFQAGCGWGDSDLEPFWICTHPGGAQIERHVPLLPLSREQAQIKHLRRSLAAYRMVFGQPRQGDLLAFLVQRVDEEHLALLVEQLRIDLHPPKSTPREQELC